MSCRINCAQNRATKSSLVTNDITTESYSASRKIYKDTLLYSQLIVHTLVFLKFDIFLISSLSNLLDIYIVHIFHLFLFKHLYVVFDGFQLFLKQETSKGNRQGTNLFFLSNRNLGPLLCSHKTIGKTVISDTRIHR